MRTVYYNINIIDTIRLYEENDFITYFIFIFWHRKTTARAQETRRIRDAYIWKKKIYNTLAHALCLSLYIILHIYTYRERDWTATSVRSIKQLL